MKITYHYFDSETQRAETEAALAPGLRFLPFWVDTVRVERLNRGPSEEARASAVCEPAYRFIRVEVYDCLYGNSPEAIRESLTHELMHALVAPLANWARDRVVALFENTNPQLHEILRSECEERVEAVVQDLAFALCRPKEDRP